MLESVTAEPGSYALLLRLSEPVRLRIGRLGTFDFPAGEYVYLGSARGPGGLRARLRHHARPAERPHWHLDFLRPHALLAGGWLAVGPHNLECAWSRELTGLAGTFLPAPGFGAADCRDGCGSHLVGLTAALRSDEIEVALQKVLDPAVRFQALEPGYFTSS